MESLVLSQEGVIKRLDLACGNNKLNGYLGVDITLVGTEADVCWDLEKHPWPFEDDSIDEIFCRHYIEHTSDLIMFMNEVYRILRVGGKATFIAPYYTSIRAWQDPTHKRTISEATFLYYTKKYLKDNNLEHYPIHTDFILEDVSYVIEEEFRGFPKDDLEFAMRHFWNVIADIKVVLCKKA